MPTSKDLILKLGAQIIFIKNDYDRHWVNGTIGTISGIDDEDGTIYVITDDGKECDKPDSGETSDTGTTKRKRDC